ncbi:uncharacterized protein LOC1272023 isoform X3 [Anopheles gambiae]|nr:uncharacterized protein LOC1272023 isoform X3 [Anopheles gambiae]XP_061501264.1 uncharacterized protein LOC1272023 isoform X3 [Anopheles gambiae]XP_061501269.1 uncharacterized protein LOC1272023 isoform X3 [Anopheles gambiae]XP_061501270.1 uncharacterized protein LOC1272023 isoform X3 [Anopheles gambiae]XP_061501271.1 uncharacterized protein LOC1272023 isoform X3 [Anopheles gambiae]XP_061501277.1 uncharacterized protein LOC1272023 isoform X3 [Anopheles gambiae]
MATVPHVWLALATVILATMHGIPATANREHKVHNIVLYPNKQSWCTTRNISQVITEPGCKQVTIDNNVCVGACFSYSIPHTEPSDPGEIIGPYCDSCQPSDVSYVFVSIAADCCVRLCAAALLKTPRSFLQVKVDCTESGNAKSPYLYKQVQLIHNCTCTACDEQSTHGTAALVTSDQQPGGGSQEHPASAHDQQLGHDHRHHAKHAAGTTVEAGSEESPSDSDMIQDDIPEILEVVHYSENDTEPIRHTPVHDLQSPHSGTTYLEQQQLNHYEHNSHTDNVKKLLHQKIVKLLRSVEETNSHTDRAELVEMIRLIKGTSDRNWDELVESLQSENAILDFNRLRSELVEEEPLAGGAKAADQEPAGSGPPEYADHQRLMHHQYDALRHRAHGEPEQPAGETPKQHQQPAGHHAVGERIDAHHHLGRGPHGSLVIQADRADQEVHRSIQNGHEITEKIHIPAHELKPNHAGTVVTYDGHGPVPTTAGAVGALGDGEPRRDHHFQTPHMHARTHHGHGHGHHQHAEHGDHTGQHHPHGHGQHKPHQAVPATDTTEQ